MGGPTNYTASGAGGAGKSGNGSNGSTAQNSAGGAGGTGNPGVGGGQGAGGGTGLPSTAQQYGGGGGGTTTANSRNAGAQGYVLITYTVITMDSSGPISLGGTGTTGNSVNLRLGNSATATITMNDAAVRSLLGKASGAISLSDAYGK